MVYLNSAKNSRLAGMTVNQNQGGGPKKAGFPGLVGRSSWDTIFYGNTGTHCCKLSTLQRELIGWKVSVPLGVGVDHRIANR